MLSAWSCENKRMDSRENPLGHWVPRRVVKVGIVPFSTAGAFLGWAWSMPALNAPWQWLCTQISQKPSGSERYPRAGRPGGKGSCKHLMGGPTQNNTSMDSRRIPIRALPHSGSLTKTSCVLPYPRLLPGQRLDLVVVLTIGYTLRLEVQRVWKKSCGFCGSEIVP